ncbi:hypothetical protein ACFO4O_12745 [Glaciecola siphonariae]|uniref:Uncharacterized protein n=1 Tax=Glaciecola siphonariae TaxID=521012 RepID=A0ABV9M083_9ALTE
MRIVVLDPGFEDISSHHANVNRELCESASAKQTKVLILASKRLSHIADIDLLSANTSAWFETPCYTNKLKALTPEKEEQLANQFCRELQAAYRAKHITNSDSLLIHSCFSFHILGIAKWLLHAQNSFAGKILICGMFYPGKQFVGNADQLQYFHWYVRYRLAFALLKNAIAETSADVKLATSCQDYIDAFTACSNMQFMLHPAITYTRPTPRVKQVRKRVILYIGTLKFDKGIDFLMQCLPDLLSKHPEIDVFIQFNEESPSASTFSHHGNTLRDLVNKHANLKVHWEPLSQSEYEQQFALSDALVLLYDQAEYKHKTSGLLWDTLRYPHMSLICSDGIWASNEYIKAGGEPILFGYNNGEAFIAGIDTWAKMPQTQAKLNTYGKELTSSFASWCCQLILPNS